MQYFCLYLDGGRCIFNEVNDCAPKQIVMAGKFKFPCPSSPNLYDTELAVLPDLYLIIAEILQNKKMLVKENKLMNLNTMIDMRNAPISPFAIEKPP